MAELRWILLLVGAGLVGAIYWWSKRKSTAVSARAESADSSPVRNEPSLDSEAMVTPGSDVHEKPDWSVAEDDPGKADRESSAASTESESRDKKIVSLRVCAKGGTFLNGLDVVKAMMDSGLMHGDFQIFHRIGPESGRIWFSIANMIEPGTFDLSKLEKMNTPGLTLFMMLPGDEDGVVVFSDMLTTARQIAERLNCELLDEKGSSLSAQAAGFIKEEIIQFQHQSA